MMMHAFLKLPLRRLACTCCVAASVFVASDAFAADLTPAAPANPPPAYNWTGGYFGANVGYAWGNSNWSTNSAGPAPLSGSLNLSQSPDFFNQSGSWFLGIQTGYNYMFQNRVVIGVEADATFPSFQNQTTGISIGDTATINSPNFGPETYTENVLTSGTVRGRIGYAPGNWLFYATGGFAWTYNQLNLTQLNTGTTDSPFLWRFGWAAGAGVEAPVAPHWTARLEYLYTDYGTSTVLFPNNTQQFSSNFVMQQLRVGLNYRFGDEGTPAALTNDAPATLDSDRLNFHAQATGVWQGYPAFHSPYPDGPQSLNHLGTSRETFDATLFAGVRLWQGAELWINPEIDQGHGLADTHGVAGYLSGEAYKIGFDYPYARIQRAFIRQTIDLGGDSEKVEADQNQFAGSQTANRLVLWVGRFYILDVFDTNKYANNPKADFLNWSIINTGSFDFAGDAWSNTYGAAAEWYQGSWTLRAGVFDMSGTPAGGGGNSFLAYGLDNTFRQFELVGEIEKRYSLWDQPGKIKVTGFLIRGDMGSYQDALNFAAANGLDVSDSLAAVRTYRSRPGVQVNLEQQINQYLGVFARAGWADGNVEPWDNTDIDRSVSAGVSINGKLWNRPDDTIGIAGVINGISAAHIAYLNAGGVGIVVGDGLLPKPGLEKILETYYSYSISASTKLSFDYQFVANPAYNTDRGPVNVFAGRLHWQF